MNKNYLIVIFLCIFSFIGGYFANELSFNAKEKTSTQIFDKIDSVVEDRKEYRDSVRKKETDIIYTAKTTLNTKIETFNTFDSNSKQQYLDSILAVDSLPRKYSLSDSQSVRIIRILDSLPLLDTLYHVELRNADRCDEAINAIDTLVDTLKVVVKQENKEAEIKGFKKGSIITATTLIIIFGLILAFK